MISIMSAQPNPNPFKSQVKSGKIPESCNDSQNHQLWHAELFFFWKCSSCHWQTLRSVSFLPSQEMEVTPPGILSPRTEVISQMDRNITDQNMLLCLRPLVQEHRCDLAGLVWKPRQQRNGRWLEEGRAAWSFFLTASWNISLLKSSQQHKAGQRWTTNLATGINLFQRSAMCRGSQWPGYPVLSALRLAGLVFCTLPEIHWGRTSARTECQEFWMQALIWLTSEHCDT